MKKYLMKLPILTGIVLQLVVLCGSFVAVLTASPVSAAAAPVVAAVPAQCNSSFFGLKPWNTYITKELNYKGATSSVDDACDLKCFNLFNQKDENACGQTNSDVPLILLAVVDDLLRIAALVAIGYIIYAAFQYLTSQGNPDATAKAQSTLVNALIGLALAIISVSIVSFLGDKLG